MQVINKKLSPQKLTALFSEYGNYFKVTVDIDKEILVAGCQLHADGEKILLDSGSLQDNIWGGGINLKTKEIDSIAVLNLRPRLKNNSLEILDPHRRDKFIQVVTKLIQL